MWEAQLAMVDLYPVGSTPRNEWLNKAEKTIVEKCAANSHVQLESMFKEVDFSLSQALLASILKAAEANNPKLHLMIGRALKTGVGGFVIQDPVLAFKHLQAALASGMEETEGEFQSLARNLFKAGNKAKDKKLWEKSYLYLRLAHEGGLGAAARKIPKLFSES